MGWMFNFSKYASLLSKQDGSPHSLGYICFVS